MEVPGHSTNGRTVGASRMLTSTQCRPRRRRQGARLAPTEKCHFATLLPLVVLLAAGVPALAADSIEELLHQDEAESHNDALRRDLNALTEEQWQYYFKVERKRPDIELDGQLMVHESEERPRVLYIWVAAIAAGFGIAIGAIQASHYLSCGGCVGRSSPLLTLLKYLRPRRRIFSRAGHPRLAASLAIGGRPRRRRCARQFFRRHARHVTQLS
jgi:hypothetical protein